MKTLEHRIRRYLLARLRRRAILDLYEAAAGVGLLERRSFSDGISANSWIVSDNAHQFLTGSPNKDRRIICRMMGRGSGNRNGAGIGQSEPDGNNEDHVSLYDWSDPSPPGVNENTAARRRLERPVDGEKISFSYLAALLKKQVPAPSPMHVAVSLLVARAIGTSLPNLSDFTKELQSPMPFVLIKAPVGRFEASLGMMLEDGLLLPFSARLEDLLRDGSLSGRYNETRPSRPRRKLKTVAGSAVLKYDDRTVRRQLRQAMTDAPAPLIAVDQTLHALTPVMTETAGLVVECAGFDRPMIADLLNICIGAPPHETILLMEANAFDPQSLSIDDLVLAVRPRRLVKHILTILAMLVDRCSSGEADHQETAGGGNGQRRSDSENARGKSFAKDGKKEQPGVDVVHPEPAAKQIGSLDTDAPKPTGESSAAATSIESLCGYGAARDWAIDLKADLALWRAGTLTWAEMSTKLLLSGPPGTGKTSFARALCNTLQVPLLVTSVANWLEPGYLGDVLRQMSGAFAHATEQAPAILFIDEIDNIGTRLSGNSKNHEDYWVSLINRLLELLDGATKTEGVVIVAATNLPDKIDPALLRSGRLETHVRIPLPDIETLTGILAHHLGNDLPGILASAPANRARLRPPVARNSDPRKLRKNSRNAKSSKAKGVTP